MKISIKDIASFLFLLTAPLLFAQRGGGVMHVGHIGSAGDSAQARLMKATDDQRMAFAKCMEATARVRLEARQMARTARTGSPWSRGRVSYDRDNLRALSGQGEQLKAALTDLEAAHHEFLKDLIDAQKSGLERHLGKLDHLQAKLNSQIPEIDHDLAAARPGPGPLNISWDINSVKSSADRWRSEHKKIGKEMGILQ